MQKTVTMRAVFLLALCCLFPAALLANKKPPPAPVNLNTATSEELQLVPGIGPVTAEKILQMRKSYGAFKSVDDLSAIRGIGPKRLEKMRKYLTVVKPPRTSPTSDPKGLSPPKVQPLASHEHRSY
jgi:competence ComEA-like helix-hairpin-helix protein